MPVSVAGTSAAGSVGAASTTDAGSVDGGVAPSDSSGPGRSMRVVSGAGASATRSLRGVRGMSEVWCSIGGGATSIPAASTCGRSGVSIVGGDSGSGSSTCGPSGRLAERSSILEPSTLSPSIADAPPVELAFLNLSARPPTAPAAPAAPAPSLGNRTGGGWGQIGRHVDVWRRGPAHADGFERGRSRFAEPRVRNVWRRKIVEIDPSRS